MLLPAVVRAFLWNQNLQEQIHVLSPVRGVPALGVACAGSSLLVSSLTYRLSRAALQKHLNLRWHKCVQLISSTVAPSSGSFFLSILSISFLLLHNTAHHRKSAQARARTVSVPLCPAHRH